MTHAPIRILVVDDSALYRQSIQNVLREISGVTIAGIAKNGVEALEQISQLQPDLLTLDVQMPDMDGIQVLRELKRKPSSPNVIMVSSLTAEGAQVTTDALMEGAFDFILKPSSSDPIANRQQLRDSLAEKICAFRESAAGSRRKSSVTSDLPTSSRSATSVAAPPPTTSAPFPQVPCRAVILGTSTGGPEALKTVMPKLVAELPVPILVVQHMPPKYTSSLAARLDKLCPLQVLEAGDGAEVAAGIVLIAPGGQQMHLERDGARTIARISDDPPRNGVRPSVDTLICSAVEVFDGNALAVIMTGMGRDGLDGCRDLKRAGGFVFAQSQEDCVVYGMPKAVIEAGLADRILSLGKIAPAIFRHVKRSQRDPQGGRL